MKLIEKIRQNQKKMENLRRIKEALDNLPSAIGYYDSYGGLKLYNRRMSALYYLLAGEDVQDLGELKRRLDNLGELSPVKRLPEFPNHYLFPDQTVWRYSEAQIPVEDSGCFTEVLFTEETQLYRKSQELKAQTVKLENIAQQLGQLSREALVLTREEEILTAKTRLHDEMGAALVAAKQGLTHPEQPEIAASAIGMFRKAVGAIKNDNACETGRGGMAQLQEDADTIGVTLQIEGKMPGNPVVEEVFLQAIRECMTNAVRHAGADALVVQIQGNAVSVTNNGAPPEEVVVARGGLLNLLHRVEAMEGTFEIQSLPVFRLTIVLPQ